MANLGINGVTSSSISCYVYNLDTAYSGNDRYIYWYANGVYKGTSYLSAYVSYGGDITLSGLSSGTSYSLQAVIYYLNGQYNTVLTNSATTLAARPAYFYWSYPKQSGGNFILVAGEWNSLLSNINAVRIYKGYPSYSFTYAVSGGTFYAYMYNQAVLAIQGISGYGYYLSTVVSGSTVFANQLNYLVSEINAVS